MGVGRTTPKGQKRAADVLSNAVKVMRICESSSSTPQAAPGHYHSVGGPTCSIRAAP